MKAQIPICIADAPTEVIDAAREIARASVNTIRNIIAEEFPATDPETQADFVRAICQFMASVDTQKLATTVLQVIRTLCNSPAITDTIWMPNGNFTVVEELCSVASALGAADYDIEEATQGNHKQAAQ